MDQTVLEDVGDRSFPIIRHKPQPSVSEKVFNALQHRIPSLELPPQTKILEAEVA